MNVWRSSPKWHSVKKHLGVQELKCKRWQPRQHLWTTHPSPVPLGKAHSVWALWWDAGEVRRRDSYFAEDPLNLSETGATDPTSKGSFECQWLRGFGVSGQEFSPGSLPRKNKSYVTYVPSTLGVSTKHMHSAAFQWQRCTLADFNHRCLLWRNMGEHWPSQELPESETKRSESKTTNARVSNCESATTSHELRVSNNTSQQLHESRTTSRKLRESATTRSGVGWGGVGWGGDIYNIYIYIITNVFLVLDSSL